ncbi:MAG TPA: hypothetical protein VHP99_11705, partial [Pyrinomonadaceae bacterium]|nr:hypothetical protein [Pyrinomonadaceae bacterium]
LFRTYAPEFCSKFVFQDDSSDLSHLIDLGFVPVSLKIDLLDDSVSPKHMMAPADSFFESQVHE